MTRKRTKKPSINEQRKRVQERKDTAMRSIAPRKVNKRDLLDDEAIAGPLRDELVAHLYDSNFVASSRELRAVITQYCKEHKDLHLLDAPDMWVTNQVIKEARRLHGSLLEHRGLYDSLRSLIFERAFKGVDGDEKGSVTAKYALALFNADPTHPRNLKMRENTGTAASAEEVASAIGRMNAEIANTIVDEDQE